MKRLCCVTLVVLLTLPALPSRADNRKKVAAIAGLGLLAAALAADHRSKKADMVSRRGRASEPEFGVEAFARPGEAMYATFNFDEVSTLVTTEDYLTAEGYRHPAGEVYYRMVVGKYCMPITKKCVEDKDGDGDLDKLGRVDGKKVDVAFEKGVARFPFSGGFRTELLYLGLANGVLRLQYREFQDDLARPAFAQELTYQVTTLPTVLVFQSLALEVTEAGNSGIAYRAWEEASRPPAAVKDANRAPKRKGSLDSTRGG